MKLVVLELLPEEVEVEEDWVDMLYFSKFQRAPRRILSFLKKEHHKIDGIIC